MEEQIEQESEWDKRRREEKQAEAVHRQVVDALAVAVAMCLDGWTVDKSNNFYPLIVKEGVGSLNFEMGKGRDPRVSIRGMLPHGNYSDYHFRNVKRDISVSAAKNPEQIAREINRRLFPEYLPAYQAALEADRASRSYEQRRIEKMNRLRDLAGVKRVINPHSPHGSGHGDKFYAFGSDLTIDHAGDGTVSIEARSIPEGLAEQIIEAFRRYKVGRCEHNNWLGQCEECREHEKAQQTLKEMGYTDGHICSEPCDHE